MKHDIVDSFAKWYLGETYLAEADYPRASRAFDSAVEIGHSRFLPSAINLWKLASDLCRVMLRENSADIPTLRSYAAGNRLKVLEGRIQRYTGGILLNLDPRHTAEAEEWFQKAIEADQRNGMRGELAQDHLSYAEFLRRKGDLPRAREALQTAATIFTECGADGWVKMAEERLAKL